MGSKRKKDGDTLAVTQLIFVDLGMQVGKNDIILLMTLNCLKFTKNKTKKNGGAITHQHQSLLLATKFL